jgi:hypothetical protein
VTSKRKASAGRSLSRKVATRRIRKTLLVFCEGERTEPEYLRALRLEPAFPDDNSSSGMYRLIASVQAPAE